MTMWLMPYRPIWKNLEKHDTQKKMNTNLYHYHTLTVISYEEIICMFVGRREQSFRKVQTLNIFLLVSQIL